MNVSIVQLCNNKHLIIPKQKIYLQTKYNQVVSVLLPLYSPHSTKKNLAAQYRIRALYLTVIQKKAK